MYHKKKLTSAMMRLVILLICSFSVSTTYALNAGGSAQMTVAKPELAKTTRQNPNKLPITNMDELMYRQPNPNVNVNGVGIFVYDGMFSLDALGPYQVFKSAALKTFFIAKNKGPITMSNGLTITVDKSIDEVTKLDVLLVPGGAIGTAMETIDPDVLAWIQQIDKTTIYTTSVCTGAWILGAAGLLEGKDASTHWYRANEMLSKFGADYTGKRWTRDGKYWTSAGVTAGLDMALALVNNLFGKEYTQAVMLDLEYNPQPPIKGGTPEKSVPIIAQLMQDMYDFFLINFVNCPTGTPGACLFN